MCRPLFTRSTAVGAPAAPTVADKSVGVDEASVACIVRGHHEPTTFDAVADGIGVRAAQHRGRAVKRRLRLGNDAGTAQPVVGRTASRAAIIADRIGAVERIVQAAPARVDRIERVACIGQGHDQLRPCDGGQLLVDIGGQDLLRRRRRLDIADLT